MSSQRAIKLALRHPAAPLCARHNAFAPLDPVRSMVAITVAIHRVQRIDGPQATSPSSAWKSCCGPRFPTLVEKRVQSGSREIPDRRLHHLLVVYQLHAGQQR